jgi:hypothetical protein
MKTRSDDIGDLMTALAKAQGEIPDIERNRTVQVTPRSGGPGYSFKYATLSAILAAIKAPLAKHGLARTQILSHDSEGGYYVLTTTLHHGNQYISSMVPLIAEGATNQQFGSALTYMKRYALAAMLGISADEDDDGNAADGNTIVAAQDKAPRTPKVIAPDPISTGIRASQAASEVRAAQLISEQFSPAKIDVQLLPDESASDWMGWGKTYIEMARAATTKEQLDQLEKNNSIPLANMKISAPKLRDNLNLALIKVTKALEKEVV